MSKRPKMLASVIRKAVAPLVLTCPRSCGIASITDVIVSSDGSSVKIFVSALNNTDAAVAYLKDHVSSMKRSLSALSFRRIPELRIEPDKRSERGGRVEKLLRGES